ncbi:MAG: YIP1 family protein, partial [Chlamydiae bacterium]|nr:YIP1 family protein [Chlamydiota bacterium]
MSRLKPWLSMWTAPRKTVRKLIETNPNYGVFWLSAAYMLQLVLFCLNFWSLGFKAPHYVLIFPSLLLSLALGFVWLFFYGWILHFTGHWFGEKAPTAHLRAALVWSKLPMTLSLLVWLSLWIYDPNGVFIQHGPGIESVAIHGPLLF